MGSTQRGNGIYLGLPAGNRGNHGGASDDGSSASRVIESGRRRSKTRAGDQGEGITQASAEEVSEEAGEEPIFDSGVEEPAAGAVQKRASSAVGNRKARAIAELSTGTSVSKVARRLSVNRSTVHRWLEDPEFARQVAVRRDELIAKAFDLHIYASLQGTRKLLQLIESNDVRLAFWAARTLLPLSATYSRIDHEKRIRLIEDVDPIEG
jgi:hypothetical protein